jgi:uncharacterized protein YlxW (UPF0749 family)
MLANIITSMNELSKQAVKTFSGEHSFNDSSISDLAKESSQMSNRITALSSRVGNLSFAIADFDQNIESSSPLLRPGSSFGRMMECID